MPAKPESERVNYRKRALEHYRTPEGQIICAHCGFGIEEVLQVCHLDGRRTNNEIANLAVLCPTCHAMHDIDLISTATIIQMRDRPKIANHKKRMKDAGKKAAERRKKNQAAFRRKWRLAGLKAAATRAKNKGISN